VVVRDGVVEKEYRYKLVGRYGKVGDLTPIGPYHIKRPHPKPPLIRTVGVRLLHPLKMVVFT